MRNAPYKRPTYLLTYLLIEAELLPIEVLHCGNGDFDVFCSRDLDLEPIIFIYELEPYSLEAYRLPVKMNAHTSRLSKVIG